MPKDKRRVFDELARELRRKDRDPVPMTGLTTSGGIDKQNQKDAWKNPMTTEGDLIVGGDSGAATRLGVGTVDQVLTSDGTTAIWADATGGGGGGAMIVQEGDSTVAAAATTLDFDASDFNVTESPSGEANIALAYGTSAGTPAEGNHSHTNDHVAVTVTDGTGIDFTLTGQNITAEPIFAGTGSAGTVAHSDHTHAGGSGDVVGPASSVDGEIALFDSTTGKLIKRATGSGIVKATSGVYSAVATVDIANGGTGQATAQAAFNALDPLTTKGDLISNNGTNSDRLAVGASNGQVLVVDSAQSMGIKWADPAVSSFGGIMPGVIFGGWVSQNNYALYTMVAGAGVTASGNALTANEMVASLFAVPVATSFDQITVQVTAFVAASTIRLGVYAVGTDGKPGALIADWGTVASTSNGQKTLSISWAPAAGWYYLVQSCTHAVSVTRFTAGMGVAPFGLAAGVVAVTGVTDWTLAAPGSAAALPNPFGAAPTGVGSHRPLWLRKA